MKSRRLISSRLRADALLLGIAAVWGLAFLFQKRAMEHIGPFTFIAVRSLLACAALLPLAWRDWRSAPDRPALLRHGLWAGLAFFGGAALQQAGMVTATVTNTGFLTSLYVVLTPLAAWLMHRKRPAASIWLAAGLCVVGTWFLSGGQLSAFSHGDGLVALSAVFWAFYVIFVRSGSAHQKAAAMTWLQFAFVGILSLPSLLWAGETVSLSALGAAWPDLIFVGVISSAGMFTLMSVALRDTPPTEASILLSTEALFAAVAAWWWLDERLTATAWLGAALITAATLLAQWKRKGTDA